jgi:murein L,D-transpeptidase YcbB/YkuD
MEGRKSTGFVNVIRDPLPIIAAVFSVLAFGIFLYVFLGDVKEELKADSIYWFIIALAAAVLPLIKQIRFRDLEITLRKEISEHREELDRRVDNLQLFVTSADWVKLSESKLPEGLREYRDRVFSDFNRRLKRADPEQRVKLQEHYTRLHLARFKITLSSVKTALAELGLYKGEISNDFNIETAEAIGRFQEMNGLEIDGIFGPMTYERLASRLSASD